MSQCNYCSLSDIKQRARKDGMKVTILADAEWGMGGTNVYVHPSEVEIHQLSGSEDGSRARYRKSWMMEIPDHCEC